MQLSPDAASAALMKDGSLRIGFGAGSDRAPHAPAAAVAAVASVSLTATATTAMERFAVTPPSSKTKSKRQASQHGGFGSAGSVRLQSIPAAAVLAAAATPAPLAEAGEEAFVQLSPGQAASALAKDGSLRIGFGSGSEHASTAPLAAAVAVAAATAELAGGDHGVAAQPFTRDGSLVAGFSTAGSIPSTNKSATLPAGFSLSADPLKRDGSLQVGFGASSSTSTSGAGTDASARIRSAAAAAAAGDFPAGMLTTKSVSGWNLGDRCTAPGSTGAYEPVVIQGWLLDEDEEDDDRAVVRLDKTGVVIVVLLSALMELASEA